MKHPSLLIGLASLAILVPFPALSQTQRSVPEPMPEQAVDTPNLFIPGQTPAPSTATSANPVIPAPAAELPQTKASEVNFISSIISANQRELRLARLAAARSQDPAIKAMAQAIVREHATNAQSIAGLSASLGIQNPGANGNVGLPDRLSNLTGAEFDTAFLKEFQSARSAKTSLLENARRISSSELQNYVNATLPMVKADSQRLGLSPAPVAPTANATALPNVSTPALPNPAGGALPAIVPGTLPSPAGGALPNVSTGPLPNPAGGSLPGVAPGPLPSPAGGALPPVTQPPSPPPNNTPSASPPPLPPRPVQSGIRFAPPAVPASPRTVPAPPAAPAPRR